MKFKIIPIILAFAALSIQNASASQMLQDFQTREYSILLETEKADFENIMQQRFADYNRIIAKLTQKRRPLIAFNSVIENPVGKQELHVHLPDGTSLLMNASANPAITNTPSVLQRIKALITRTNGHENQAQLE